MRYVELHRHGEYSHDASGVADAAARYAVELGQSALALTDHGNINGLFSHYSACKRAGIKPVLGCELYFQPTFVKPTKRAKDQTEDPAIDDHDVVGYSHEHRYHLLTLVQDQQGYKNLCKLLTEANATNYYKFPIVTLDLLARYHKGLIFTTGCVSGFIPSHIAAGRIDLATSFLDWLRQLVGPDRLYLEVQPFDAPGQRETNDQLLKWSEQYTLPLLMTSDAHFVHSTDYADHRALQLVRKPYMDGLLHDFSVRHQHTADTMLAHWNDFMMGDLRGEQAIENTAVLADRCDVTFSSSFKMPDLPWLHEKPNEVLIRKIGAGLRALGLFTMVNGKQEILPAYKARASKELRTIIARGYAPYLLLCEDVVSWTRDQGIEICARGSTCNSLVTYALGFHKVNPLRFGLIAERFISELSGSSPDVDLDVESARRQEVIDYITAKYPGQTAQIISFGTFKQASILNGLAKTVHALNFIEKETFRNSIEQYPDAPLSDDMVAELMDDPDIAKIEKVHGLLSTYRYMYNQVTHWGTHAAGVAITDLPLTDYMAVNRVGSGSDIHYVCSANKDVLAEFDFLKIDILGLHDLSILKLAKQLSGFDYDNETLYEQVLTDRDVFAAFSRGDTIGIPQLEKWTARRMCREMQPTCVADIAAVSAANRPAPLLEKTFEAILEGKAGRGNTGKFWYPAAASTYGGLLYQESIRQICTDYAKMTPTDADYVLKLLKHYPDDDPRLAALFIDGIVANGFAERAEAAALWRTCKRYLFNGGHATSYAILAVEMMYMKTHYPAAFFAAVLHYEKDKDKRRVYTAEAAKRGIPVLIPHINGGSRYSLVQIGDRFAIQEGLINITGIGPVTCQAIDSERESGGPFVSMDDAKARLTGQAARLEVLKGYGALQFDKRVYKDLCVQYARDVLMHTPIAI